MNNKHLMHSPTHLRWQPIPVHTVPTSEDYTSASSRRCDCYDYETAVYERSPEYRGFFRQHRTLFEYLERNSGRHLTSLADIFLLYDTLYIDRLKSLCLPQWAERVKTPEGEFEDMYIFFYQFITATPGMQRLKTGFLLREILNRCADKAQSTLSPNRNIWMHFAHVITITNMLNTLGLYRPHIPPYVSCILFELYRWRDTVYLQLYYRTNADENLRPLDIPNCGTRCPLDRFYNLYSGVIPTGDFESECMLQEGETLPEGGNPNNHSV